jgi:hypothetical protein
MNHGKTFPLKLVSNNSCIYIYIYILPGGMITSTHLTPATRTIKPIHPYTIPQMRMPPAATSIRGLRPAPGEYVYPVAETTTPMNPKEEPT